MLAGRKEGRNKGKEGKERKGGRMAGLSTQHIKIQSKSKTLRRQMTKLAFGLIASACFCFYTEYVKQNITCRAYCRWGIQPELLQRTGPQLQCEGE